MRNEIVIDILRNMSVASITLSKEDEALYDRQIRLWGRAAQQKYTHLINAASLGLRFLLIGLRTAPSSSLGFSLGSLTS